MRKSVYNLLRVCPFVRGTDRDLSHTPLLASNLVAIIGGHVTWHATFGSPHDTAVLHIHHDGKAAYHRRARWCETHR